LTPRNFDRNGRIELCKITYKLYPNATQAARVVLRWATGEMSGQELPPAREDVPYETPAFTLG
jgi:hypothetical protein